MSKKKKVRVELRKNRSKPPRENDITRQFSENAAGTADAHQGERVRAKGDVSRHRTIMVGDDGNPLSGTPNSANECVLGRVFRVHGLFSYVELEDGRVVRCSVRRLLKSLAMDERNVVTTGDRVWVRMPEETETSPPNPLSATERGGSSGGEPEGMIERVEPRHGMLTRASRRREHVLVANVDQLVIVMSVIEPDLKPHLIDRYLASAEKGGLKPVLCLNKADRMDTIELQPMIGAYSQMGVPTLLTSARTGYGVERLRDQLRGRASVFSGQSGVGKSSLLNAVQPELALRVKAVSENTQKGVHTTTTAELIRLDFGGWVVDTPGVRQLQLWDTRPEEVEGYFPEFRTYVPLCGYPDCTHTHEQRCAVKAAVARKHIAERRYFSYLGLFRGQDEE